MKKKSAVRFFSILFLCLFTSSFSQDDASGLSRLSVIPWKTAGPPEVFKKDGLFGYIDGGAELFLQYGFEELSVIRYTDCTSAKAEREITIEAYRMATPAEAFGIFSLKREGGERVSPGIVAIHWLSPSQAGLVKGNLYVSIMGLNASAEEVEAFTAAASRKIGGASTLPAELSLLPSSGRKKGSERYIQGKLAAEGESLLLDRPFWGFGEGAIAVSAKYGASEAKLVVVIPAAPVPCRTEEVKALFSEYLEDVAVRDGLLGGKNAAGRWFLFASEGGKAFLVLAEPDYDAAVRILRDAAQN